MKKIYKLLLVPSIACLTLLGLTNDIHAQCTATTMCPQVSTNAGNVRGYYFVAPVSFTICGLFIPTDASSGSQSIEVVRFGTAPPAYPAVTNNFTSLFYVSNNTSSAMIPCNISVNMGDTIGVYGARDTTTICSYIMPQCSVSILGNPTTLYRSGMQFPLYNQQMHDIWSEIANDLSSVIMYVDAANAVPEAVTNASVNVYPNPTTNGIFTIAVQGKTKQSQLVEIYNVLGEKVYSQNLNLQTPQEINLSDSPKGVYFVKIYDGEKIETEKIVIQ